MKTAALARAFGSANGNEKAVSPVAGPPGLDFGWPRPPSSFVVARLGDAAWDCAACPRRRLRDVQLELEALLHL